MVMQDPKYSLNPVMRVGRQIIEAYRAHTRASAAEARDKTLAMLEAVQIRDPRRVMRAYPHELSGGMGQRATIAMMLVNGPDLQVGRTSGRGRVGQDGLHTGGCVSIKKKTLQHKSTGHLALSHQA